MLMVVGSIRSQEPLSDLDVRKAAMFAGEASLTDAEPGCDGGSNSMEVRAELTATVWKVVAEQGATVAEGDELVILESMKMEIPAAAPVAGTVTEPALRKKTPLTRVI